MSVTTTLAPSAANRLAIASPMPLPDPVTTATLPSSFMPTSVDQHVDLAEGGQGVGDHPGHLVFNGHVGRAPERVGGSLLAGELGHQLARGGVAADDHHPGTLGGERQRDPRPIFAVAAVTTLPASPVCTASPR